MLSAALILSIMVIPFSSSVAREVLKAVPQSQREGAYALGATRWEAIRMALFYARTGIVGAVMLGFGRALGETMAVTMVIGNNPQISASLYAPQYTMAAVLANEFAEATGDLYLHALVEIGLVLFIITLIINVISRLFIWSMGRQKRPRLVLAARRLGGGRMTRDRWRRAVSHVIIVLCGAQRAHRAGAARPGAVLRRHARASRSLSLSFFTEMPKPVGETGGGMANAIVGSLIVTSLGAAVRHSHRHHERHLRRRVQLARAWPTPFASPPTRLNGVPSIVIGVFVYSIAVLPFRRFSALAGGLALGIMMIPLIMRTTEELLRLVPSTLREGALALGATRGARGLHRRGPGGPARHSDRHPAGAGAHRRRDRAAALHGAEQPVLLDRRPPADRDADRTGLHLRHRPL